jgi:diguanylate cyclase (GGDEF)-like protein
MHLLISFFAMLIRRVVKSQVAPRLLRLLTRFATSSTEAPESALRKTLGMAMMVVGLLAFPPFGLTYLAYGENAAGLVAMAEPLVCLVLLLLFRLNGRFDMLAIAYVSVYVIAIVGVHILLGGLWQSGVAIVWTLIAPPLLTIVLRPQAGAKAAVLIVLILALLFAGDPWLAHPPRLPEHVVMAIFVANVVGFSLFIWLAIGFYVWRNSLLNESLVKMAVEKQRARSALFDPLTGIPNREGIKQAIAGTFPLTVLVVDLDRFKAINTALGRVCGDQILILLVQFLSKVDGITLGRLHADRFVMMWPGTPPLGEMDQEIARLLKTPAQIEGQVIDLSATIGVARSGADDDLEQTMHNAEIALTVARSRYRRCLEYEREMEQQRPGDLSLMSDLNMAIARRELRMFLQPKVRLTDGAVVSAEALIRWQHPVYGMVPPMDFIPFAEQTGRIGLLTYWILEEAMRTAAARRRRGQPLQISVNICAADLANPDFGDGVCALMAQTQVNPIDIRLEITESGLMEQPELSLATMTRLRAVGFSWSIDDFGSGYSSLSHLQRMPVIELKIDRSLVEGIGTAKQNPKLLRSAIRMGHALGLIVVCEGAETAKEWACLVEMRADYAQGWFASKPLPIDEFDVWCAQHLPFCLQELWRRPPGRKRSKPRFSRSRN